MTDFALSFEFEPAPWVQGPELASTYARLELTVGGCHVTELEDLRSKAIRSSIYAPLYPIAEWFAMNWWPLWFEDRARWEGSEVRQRHSLRRAEEGFALPEVLFLPAGNDVLLESVPYSHEYAAVRFLHSGRVHVPKRALRDRVRDLIRGVLERVPNGTVLEEEWTRIQQCSEDQANRDFCQAAGRLGLDPYAIAPAVGREIDRANRELPDSMRADFFDSSSPSELGPQLEPILAFLRVAEQQRVAAAHASIRHPEYLPGNPPWEEGYAYARLLRRSLGISEPRFASPEEVLTRIGWSQSAVRPMWKTTVLDAVTGVSRDRGPTFAVRAGLAPSRNFALCRAVGEFLFKPEPLLLTQQTESYRQKRSRAFAAEFLAPAEQIKAFLPNGGTLTPDDCAEIAEHFNVSPWVIEKQITNHKLGTVVSPSF